MANFNFNSSALPKSGRVYLSGPITGYDTDERRSFFGRYENALVNLGYEVVNPMNNGLPQDPDFPVEEHMKVDIKNLCGCDAILMLPEWSISKGAKFEMQVAARVGITIAFVC